MPDPSELMLLIYLMPYGATILGGIWITEIPISSKLYIFRESGGGVRIVSVLLRWERTHSKITDLAKIVAIDFLSDKNGCIFKKSQNHSLLKSLYNTSKIMLSCLFTIFHMFYGIAFKINYKNIFI